MGQTDLEQRMQNQLLQVSKREEFKRKYQILEDYITTPVSVITPKQQTMNIDK